MAPKNAGKNGIPDRWLPYSACGKPIEGTRFVAFKVPLKEIILNKMSFSERFGADDLVKQLPNLKLVIDLTNTARYYHPCELTERSIEHVKLACVGRQLPEDSLLERFYYECDKFLENNPESDSLIGVHCTHGVNRTGYFICKYMIDKMGIEPTKAIELFNKARGHDMERPIFLNALKPDSVIQSNLPRNHNIPAVSITGSNNTSSAYFKAQREKSSSNRARSHTSSYYRSNQHKSGSSHNENSQNAPYQNSNYSNNLHHSNPPYHYNPYQNPYGYDVHPEVVNNSNPPYNSNNPYQVTNGYAGPSARSSHSNRSNQPFDFYNTYQTPPQQSNSSDPSNPYNPYQVSYGYDDQPEEYSGYRYNRGGNKSHRGRGNH